jgi:hypothetical protein
VLAKRRMASISGVPSSSINSATSPPSSLLLPFETSLTIIASTQPHDEFDYGSIMATAPLVPLYLLDTPISSIWFASFHVHSCCCLQQWII